jgi:hypothetical protein
MEIGFKFILLGAIVGMAVTSAAQPQDSPHITVIVRFAAEVPTRLISDAEQPAARIFEKAGVSVRWLNCARRDGVFLDQACNEPLTPTHLVIQVLAQAHSAADPVFGISFIDAGGGVFADIFLDRMQHLHEQSPQTPFPQLVGAVIAHELGHLLLGENAHSREGLMQAHWSSDELKKMGRGNLLFGIRAAAQLRRRVVTLDAQTSPTILASAGN